MAFIFATWVIVFAGWQTYTTLLVAMLIGYGLIAASYAFNMNDKAPRDGLGRGAVDRRVLRRDGDHLVPRRLRRGRDHRRDRPFTHVLDKGGTDDIGLGGTLAASAVWALVIYFWAVHSRLPESKVDEYVRDVYPPSVEGH